MVNLLDEESQRSNELPGNVDLDTEYFVECLDGEGIAVSFLMGGTSVGPVGIRTAINEATLREVMARRIAATRLLYNGLPDPS